MKLLNKISIVMALLATVISFSQIQKAEVIATGLTCSMCSNAINKQFKTLAEVDSVSTDLNTNTFTVYLKKDNTIKPRVLKEKVEKAGFFVGSMVVSVNFDNQKITDNATIKKDDLSFIFIDTKDKTLNGNTQLRILDKGYITQKEYKKMSKSFSKYATYGAENEDDYHLKTL